MAAHGTLLTAVHAHPSVVVSVTDPGPPAARIVTPGALSVYVPRLRVPLEAWCEWTASPWDKVQSVVGRSFRVVGQHENVYTMAANAVLRLIRNNDIDPRDVGWLGLGTESSTDNAVGAVIVRGMVDQALDKLALPRLSRQLEVPEFDMVSLLLSRYHGPVLDPGVATVIANAKQKFKQEFFTKAAFRAQQAQFQEKQMQVIAEQSGGEYRKIEAKSIYAQEKQAGN